MKQYLKWKLYERKKGFAKATITRIETCVFQNALNFDIKLLQFKGREQTLREAFIKFKVKMK